MEVLGNIPIQRKKSKKETDFNFDGGVLNSTFFR
jgi:hypothetical protein